MNIEFLNLREYVNSLAVNPNIIRNEDNQEVTEKVTTKIRQLRNRLIKTASTCGPVEKQNYIFSIHQSLVDFSTAYAHIPQLQSCLNPPLICFSTWFYKAYHSDYNLAWRPVPAFASNVLSKYSGEVDEICNAIEKSDADKQLVKIVCDYLLQRGYSFSSFTSLHYHKIFVRHLYKKLLKQPLTTNALINALANINFNSSAFISYFLKQFRQDCGPGWNFATAELQIKSGLKIITKMPEHPSAAYNPSAPSLCGLAHKLLIKTNMYNFKRYAAAQQLLLDQKSAETERKRQLLKEKKKTKNQKKQSERNSCKGEKDNQKAAD